MDSPMSYFVDSPPDPRIRSQPIRIPSRRKEPSPSIRSCSPISHSASPEMIFHMSPLDESTPSNYHISVLPVEADDEPLLYHFPTLPSHRCHNSKPQHPTRRSAVLGRAFSPALREVTKQPKNWPQARCSPRTSPKSTAPLVVRSRAVKKIKGFEPLYPSSENSSVEASPVQHVTPTKDWASFSASSWILPGRDDIRQEALSSSFSEFDQLLLRRIEAKAAGRGRRTPMTAAL